MFDQSRATEHQRPALEHKTSSETPSLIPSRILLVGLRVERDVLMGLPLLDALRRRFPHCQLAWLTSSQAAPLLADHAAGLEIITVQNNWRRRPWTVFETTRAVRAFSPSVVLDLTASYGSALLASLSRAQRRIGHVAAEPVPWLVRRQWNIPVTALGPTGVETRLRLLEPLGVHRPTVRFGMAPCRTDQSTIDRMLDVAGLHEPLALIHVGARRPELHWRTERFAAVARYLGHEHGIPSLLLATSADECARAEAIRAASRDCARIITTQSVARTIALVKRASLVLGADSWLMHAAAAVGTPSVGLYAPEIHSARAVFGPHHTAIRSVWAESTTDADRSRRDFAHRAMGAISHGEVCRACERLLLALSPVTVEQQRRRRA